jgi:hypothetical protein
MSAPTNPGFWSYLSSNANNVTGDGTSYDVVCDSVAYDNWSQYDSSTGVFTAAFTRVYEISGSLGMKGIGLLNAQINVDLVTTGGTKRIFTSPASGLVSADYGMSFSRQIFMNENDTAKLVLQVTGTGKGVDILGGSSPYFSEFGAYLLS